MTPPLDNDMERTSPQTESTRERERGLDLDIDEDELGEGGTWEEDDIGDIADEGRGHRG